MFVFEYFLLLWPADYYSNKTQISCLIMKLYKQNDNEQLENEKIISFK